MGKVSYILFSSFILFLVYEISRISNLEDVYPEIGYSIKELVDSQGYKMEEHEVITEDGYILELHRIMTQSRKPGKPILIMHGLTANSLSWILNLKKSLPFHLANQDFDIWLGNSRGNSGKHLKIDANVNPEEFYNYSWHEIGAIDVPTMIDYILEKTAFQKLTYIGHSQGTLVFYVMMSEKPEYNQKVDLMIGLAPAVYLHNISHILYRTSPRVQEYVEWFISILGIYRVLPKYDWFRIVANAYCHDGSYLQSICYYPFMLLGGYDFHGINSTLLPLMISNYGAGSSMKQSFHYSQVVITNRLQKYDNGERRYRRNVENGSALPDLYYLNRTVVPVAIFWNENDLFITEENIERLYRELPNGILNHRISGYFCHVDYVISNKAEHMIYPLIINLIKNN